MTDKNTAPLGNCVFDISDDAKCDLPAVRKVYDVIWKHKLPLCEAHAQTIEHTQDERRKAIERVHEKQPMPDMGLRPLMMRWWGPSKVDEGMADASVDCGLHIDGDHIFKLGEPYFMLFYEIKGKSSSIYIAACESCGNAALEYSRQGGR